VQEFDSSELPASLYYHPGQDLPPVRISINGFIPQVLEGYSISQYGSEKFVTIFDAKIDLEGKGLILGTNKLLPFNANRQIELKLAVDNVYRRGVIQGVNSHPQNNLKPPPER
jgi:hypothetical protein